MNNLISNAVKFTKNGKIWIDYNLTNQNEILINVADNGIGMTEKK